MMTQPIPPGWYPDPQQPMTVRYWDGYQWTAQTAPAPVAPIPMVQPNVRQSRDRAQYMRQQRGHSLVKHIFLGWILLYIPTVYYAVSPNHYFHA